MTQYVCGFYFDHTHRQVVLIWKNKPAWQKGKLNGVGGKIEAGESRHEAMRREFKEETGIQHEDWMYLISLSGPDWCVYFFYAEGKPEAFEYAQTMEDEEVAKITIDYLDDFAHIPNLRWLVPMALYALEHPKEIMSMA
jgi:8-oxo-dGTP diphosphatase